MKTLFYLFCLILPIFVTSCATTELVGKGLPERKLGKRPILFNEYIEIDGQVNINPTNDGYAIKIGENDGFKYTDEDVSYYADGQQVINFKPYGIEFVTTPENAPSFTFAGLGAEDAKENLREELGVTAGTFLSVSNPVLSADLTLTNASLILLPENQSDPFEYVGLFNSIQNYTLKKAGLVISKGSNQWAALTVADELGDDLYPNDSSPFNYLARIKNSVGDYAVIWDKDNLSAPINFVSEPPTNINDTAGFKENDFAIKIHNGTNYATFFDGADWNWWVANTNNFPWQ